MKDDSSLAAIKDHYKYQHMEYCSVGKAWADFPLNRCNVWADKKDRGTQPNLCSSISLLPVPTLGIEKGGDCAKGW